MTVTSLEVEGPPTVVRDQEIRYFKVFRGSFKSSASWRTERYRDCRLDSSDVSQGVHVCVRVCRENTSSPVCTVRWVSLGCRVVVDPSFALPSVSHVHGPALRRVEGSHLSCRSGEE